ncbi:hypothetical protein [Gaopeijia maritima]|uniref:hypothetical protein n=1 Tax=Gaopeijia maritima TaxID=3119007 RepID=UPI00324512C3
MRLAEVLVALALGGLLVAGVWRSSASIRGDLATLSVRATTTDARRVVGLILDQEAGGLVADPAPTGEAAVRAHRWWGVVCDTLPTPGRAVLRHQGLRQPDPDKDSLLLVAADGRMFGRRLDAVRSVDGCGGRVIQVAWTPDPGEAFPRVVRGFERGFYRLDEAFRYRRDRGGAQPLTAEVFDPDSLWLEIDSLGLLLRWEGRAARVWPREAR